MFNLDIIKDNSIIFAKRKDKQKVLEYFSEKSLFLSVGFFEETSSLLVYKNNYLIYLKNKYNITPALATKMKNVFDYIDINHKYQTDKINKLLEIKKDLLNENIIKEQNLNLNSKAIFTLNHTLIPSYFNIKDKTEIYSYDNNVEEITLYKTRDQYEQALAVLESVIALLESNIPIDDIVVLNSFAEDDYYLDKLFFDANIPLTINKPRYVNELPFVVSLLKTLKTKGFLAFKNYLDVEIIAKNINPAITQKLVGIYNKYTEQEMINHPEIIYFEIENLTYQPQRYEKTVNVFSFSDFDYQENKNYILMNYCDNFMPKRDIDNDYLTDSEKAELGIYTSIEINDYKLSYYKLLLNGIKNLTLVFPKHLEDDMRLPDIELHRLINTIDYKFEVKPTSYFQTYDEFLYAVKKYDLENYYQKSIDYGILNNTYANNFEKYNPQFTGIYDTTLKRLLTKHNSLTGAKIESLNLCPFQYFLNYLLKIEEFKPSLSQYLGSLSHKVLEEKTKNPDITISKIINDFNNFPEDIIYKKELFLHALETDLIELVKTVLDFQGQTDFNKILTEQAFEIKTKFDKEIVLSGIIDKTLIKAGEESSYFVIVDYKLGNKDFSMDKFNQGRQLQLPFYLYCFINMNDDLTMIPVGFYYQTTSLGRANLDDKEVREQFQLKGISLNDTNLMMALDKELLYLKGINLKNDGSFRKSSRLLNDIEFKELYNTTEKLIKNAIDKIKRGEFEINPLLVIGSKKDSVSCEYCNYYSVCYSKNKKMEVDIDE